jgi:hypothetical protein
MTYYARHVKRTALTAFALALTIAASNTQASEGPGVAGINGKNSQKGSYVEIAWNFNTRRVTRIFTSFRCRSETGRVKYAIDFYPKTLKMSAAGKFKFTGKGTYTTADGHGFGTSKKLGKGTLSISGTLSRSGTQTHGSGRLRTTTPDCSSGTIKWSGKGSAITQ